MQVQKNRHRFVATPSIQAEWKTHASGFATRWLASMFARRLVEKLEDDPVVPTLRQAISQMAGRSPQFRRCSDIAAKDIHLVEAALATDRIVISRDIEALRCLRLSERVKRRTGAVVWICPVTNTQPLMAWFIDTRSALIEYSIGA